MQAFAITDFFYFYKNKSDILIYSINYQFWTMMVAMGFSEAIRYIHNNGH